MERYRDTFAEFYDLDEEDCCEICGCPLDEFEEGECDECREMGDECPVCGGETDDPWDKCRSCRQEEREEERRLFEEEEEY